MIGKTMPPINLHTPRAFLDTGRALAAAALALAMLGSLGCVVQSTSAVAGSGNRTTEQRPVDEPFDTVELLGSPTVMVHVNPEAEPAVSVTTDDNLQSHIKTEIASGKLRVQAHGSISPTSGVRVDVVAPQIDMVLLSGSGNLIVSGLETPSLQAELRGSGDIGLSGRADEVTLELSGSGDIDARDLVARTAQVRVNGSGDITLHATTAADLAVSGSGDILCLGNPQQRTAHVSGSGDIDIR